MQAESLKCGTAFQIRNPIQASQLEPNMSHHDESANTPIDSEVMDANSRADAVALFSLVMIIVSIAAFFASR